MTDTSTIPTRPDVDDLPPTQYLILEVLAARLRLGEPFWTFPDRLRRHAAKLEQAGLVWLRSGPAPGAFQVWPTDSGRAAILHGPYVPPVARETAEVILGTVENGPWALIPDPGLREVVRAHVADACHSIACAAGLDEAMEVAHDACPVRLPTALTAGGRRCVKPTRTRARRCTTPPTLTRWPWASWPCSPRPAAALPRCSPRPPSLGQRPGQ